MVLKPRIKKLFHTLGNAIRAFFSPAVGIVIILLGVWATLSWRFGSADPNTPELGYETPQASRYYAPVSCGDYFLYLHPSYYKLPERSRAAQRYIVFVISKTPPEAKVATIEQLSAYGVAQNTLETNRPTLFPAEIHRREDLRPAMWAEVSLGDRVDGSFCMPYRPFDLQCEDRSPWCGPPKPVKKQVKNIMTPESFPPPKSERLIPKPKGTPGP